MPVGHLGDLFRC